jgi:hypothetical protein
LPLRLTRVGNKIEPIPWSLSAKYKFERVCFAPCSLEPGTAVELEVALVNARSAKDCQMCTAAHIVRAEESDMPGWRGYAASFDDFAIRRDDVVPTRYRTS